jgi:hypothetical protein
LYLIHSYDNETPKNPFPEIDKKLLAKVASVVSRRLSVTGNVVKSSLDDNDPIVKFYESHYKNTLVDSLPISNPLSRIFEYEIPDLFTHIKTNTKEHFMKHLNRLINAYFDRKDLLIMKN